MLRMRDRTGWLVQISCLLIICSTKSCTVKRTQQDSNPDRLKIKHPPTTNRGNMTWRSSSHQMTSYTDSYIHPRGPRWALLIGSLATVVSILERGKQFCPNFPLSLWAPGCWHYERTLYSYRPLHKGPEFLSIWIKSVVMSIYIYHGHVC